MTLPTSGPLSLNDIQTEFGGSNPISLNEYYAGGANVPAGTTGTYGAVPSSGAISIQNFYGTAKVTALAVSISPSSLYTTRVGAGTVVSAPATATASGGSGGYTYAWTYVSGNSFSVTSPTSASTTFSTSLLAAQYKLGVYRCTVTDSLSNTAHADITIEFEAI